MDYVSEAILNSNSLHDRTAGTLERCRYSVLWNRKAYAAAGLGRRRLARIEVSVLLANVMHDVPTTYGILSGNAGVWSPRRRRRLSSGGYWLVTSRSC